ncbi:MAG: class I SAM-dependent methyltransferase [Pseudomonadota bacterium]
MPETDVFALLRDPKVSAVLQRLHNAADKQTPRLLAHYLPQLPRILTGREIPFTTAQATTFYADKYLPLDRDQAAFCYQTVRALGATTVAEFGTSFGISTIWLAAAVRDNGGGRVIGTELVPAKAEQALANVAEAGLADYVEVRVGDARTTLADGPEQIDFLLNDGFPMLALEILQLLTPRIRPGGVVLTDNVGTFKANFRDYVAHVREPANGYVSSLLPYKSGTEYSVRIAADDPG